MKQLPRILRRAVKRVIRGTPLEPLAWSVKPLLLPAYLRKNARYDQQTILVMKRCLVTDSNCIDVGCHTGSFLEHMLQIASQGTHFGFEPLPQLYAELVGHYRSRPNVRLYELALGDKVGRTTFQHVVSNPGYSGFRIRRYNRPNETVCEISVKLDRLDNVIPDGLPIHFMKIDVEGAELQVFRGAVETIRRNRPTMVFEHGLGAADFYSTSPEEVYDLLVSACDLRLFLMDRWLAGKPALSRQEFSDEFYRGHNFYFMAHD